MRESNENFKKQWFEEMKDWIKKTIVEKDEKLNNVKNCNIYIYILKDAKDVEQK